MPTTASLARLSQYNGRSVEGARAEFAGIGAEVIADFARYGVALDARTFGAYCAKLAAKGRARRASASPSRASPRRTRFRAWSARSTR